MDVTIWEFLESYNDICTQNWENINDTDIETFISITSDIINWNIAYQCFPTEEADKLETFEVPVNTKLEKTTIIQILEEFDFINKRNLVINNFLELLSEEIEFDIFNAILNYLDEDNWNWKIVDYINSNDIQAQLSIESPLYNVVIGMPDIEDEFDMYDLLDEELQNLWIDIEDQYILENNKDVLIHTGAFKNLIIWIMNNAWFTYINGDFNNTH